MEEIWKDIPKYKGFYQASSLGNIKSIKHSRYRKAGTILHHFDDGTMGYRKLTLYGDNGRKAEKVHQIIASAFLDNPENKPQINHKNGDKTDNRIENLEYCTNSENQKHAYAVCGKVNPWKGKFGSEHNQSKRVAQYNLNMELIKIHDSIGEAAAEVKISRATIIANCHNKRKSKYPYIWRLT